MATDGLTRGGQNRQSNVTVGLVNARGAFKKPKIAVIRSWSSRNSDCRDAED